MALKSTIPAGNYPEMFAPKHPHRRLHILLSFLAFMVVAGSIALYQIDKIKKEIASYENNFTIESIKKEPVVKPLSAEETAAILANIKTVTAKSPPLTKAQREKAIETLKASLANQNK